MREAVAVMDNPRSDRGSFHRGDLDFHLALAEAAANPLILSLIDSIVGLLREQRMRIFYVEGGPERGQYHHKRILEAIEAPRCGSGARGDAGASAAGTGGFAQSAGEISRRKSRAT